MGILPAIMTVNHIRVWCPWRPEGGTGHPETRITDSCEPPWGCWVPNLGLPEEQPVLLTTQPSLYPVPKYSKYISFPDQMPTTEVI